jgi:dUTP pyrophosphatase
VYDFGMEIPIKRIDKELPLPEYKTAGAAAVDCAARENTSIPARGIGYVPLNFALSLPKNHVGLLAARSSLHKRGLMFANSIGIFDEDYSGDGDEFKAILYNFLDEPVEILKGDRIAQLIIIPRDRVTWNEVESLGNPDRGGMGTTGK